MTDENFGLKTVFKITYVPAVPLPAIEYSQRQVSEILFVIVLYNLDLEYSLTYQSLLTTTQHFNAEGKIDLLICDNSPNPQSIKNVSNLDIYYLHDKLNPGVSASYNRAADFAQSKSKKWLLILDQDSTLPIDALSSYVDALDRWPHYPVYAPQVLSSKKLLSPCRYLMYRGTHFQNITFGVHKLKYKNVLNSGLLLSLDAFRQVGGYDQQVWLYFSDFTYFNKLKKVYSDFVVLNCHIDHDISSSDFSNVNFALKRFSYYCEGARAASKLENNIIAYISYCLTVGLRSLKMFVRFKNVKFIKIFWRNFFLL